MKRDILKEILLKKRNSLIKSLVREGYNYNQVGIIFNVAHTTVMRLFNK